MKILHAYRTYFPDTQGGLEETVRQICLNTIAHGAEHKIFTLSKDPTPAIIDFPEGQVHRYPLSLEVSSCGFSLTGVGGFRRLAQWADIIHYHFPWPYEDLLHLLARVRKPTVVSYQSDIVRQKGLLQLYKPLRDYFLASVHRIVATSPNYLASSEVLTALRDKVTIIPNGLAEDNYSTVSAEMLRKMEEQHGRDFFLFIGVLRYYKGLQYLLEACANTNFPVLVAGMGPMESQLKQLARDQNVQNVKFLGYVDDEVKNCLMRLARAIVFPSCERSEAFGITLLEGAMRAKPLISAEIGTGTTYINKHMQTGLVVPPKDPDSLREAMGKLQQDAELAERLGQGARKRFEKLFTGEEMGRRYAEIYKELLAEGV